MFSRRVPTTSKNLSFNAGLQNITFNTLCTSYPFIPESLLDNNFIHQNKNNVELEPNDLVKILSELYVNINH
ncbi:hypothetical protein QJ854_gp435 [Moumouvirus goulette]|uniref:Uncharacterized protein n=1 Tax=Moumouvirus goulette TaxID=1247379 RepID=M1PX66_9VIRU|nr:hypothetical protein QJ854_gp435 [Moumouvirus goulette]AGF85347.1 hypothetical protein glt_00538 [Moumouvirus goulette]